MSVKLEHISHLLLESIYYHIIATKMEGHLSLAHRFLKQIPATFTLGHNSVWPYRFRVTISRDPRAPSRLQRATFILFVRFGRRARLSIPFILQTSIAQVPSVSRVPQRGLMCPAFDTFWFAAERHRISLRSASESST